MNEKGFTLVELLTSFLFISLITLSFFNITKQLELAKKRVYMAHKALELLSYASEALKSGILEPTNGRVDNKFLPNHYIKAGMQVMLTSTLLEDQLYEVEIKVLYSIYGRSIIKKTKVVVWKEVSL